MKKSNVVSPIEVHPIKEVRFRHDIYQCNCLKFSEIVLASGPVYKCVPAKSLETNPPDAGHGQRMGTSYTRIMPKEKFLALVNLAMKFYDTVNSESIEFFNTKEELRAIKSDQAEIAAEEEERQIKWEAKQKIKETMRLALGPVPPENRSQKGPGFVYLAKLGDLHKIGLSKNPRKRAIAFALSATDEQGFPELLITKSVSNMRAAETVLLEKFAEFKHHGEWFNFSTEVLPDVLTAFEEAS